MYTVSLRYQKTYALKKVRDCLEEILSASWGSFSSLKPGDYVLLKPNLLSAKPPESAVTTHPIVIEAMIQILVDAGCKITVGDSPAIHKFSTVLKRAGLESLRERYPVQFQELDSPIEVKGIENGIYKSFDISRHCFECDYFINMAKFKTHSMMGMTLCVKNLFGCVPGRKKAAWHLAIGKNRALFAQMLSELAAVLPVDFHLIDGIVGMEGNGPGNGTPINLGVLLGGENAPAVDAVAAQLVGLSPGELLTCRMSAEIKAGPADEGEISFLEGSLSQSPIHFRLPEPMQTDWHLPGIFKGILRWAFLPLPRVEHACCKGCLDCMKVCPPCAIVERDGKVSIKESLCIRCYCCQEICPENAIYFTRKGKTRGITINHGLF